MRGGKNYFFLPTVPLHMLYFNTGSLSWTRIYYNSAAVEHHNFKVINKDLIACFNLTNSVSYGFLGISRTDRAEIILKKG